MNTTYLQEYIACTERNIEGKEIYAPGYCKRSNNNVSYAESHKYFSTENPCMDCEDSNKSKCLNVQYASLLEPKRNCVDDNGENDSLMKEILCVITDT